ncbi:MAG: tetratricopeptide repeat protein [Synergistaceae bacterium]|nr:tetratricopeptide repeat protein [Synergistaceae bacterium]
MNRKHIAVLVIVSLLSLNTLTPAQAFWPFGSSGSTGKDLRFETVYPVSFWKSTTGKILMYTGIAVTVAVITYFSAGTGTAASAGVIAKFIGGTIGSWWFGLSGGAAINAGLALLGGGAVAAGGLGILGGVSVLSAVGSVALSAAIDTAIGHVPSGTHAKTITLIKPRLLRDNVSPVVKSEMKELHTLLDEIAKGGTDSQAKRAVQLMERIDWKLTLETKSEPDDYTAYNYLLMAVIRYNLNNFDGAREASMGARNFTDTERSSVLDYVDALLAFQAGDDSKAVNLLRGITEAEPKASTPYIVLGQSAFDEGRYHEAFDILDRGIKAGCDEVCAMNWMAGNSLYNAGSYKAAIPYYKTVLRNMTINEIEALYKLNIAKCYRKMNDSKEGEYWLNDAISEVKDNAGMVAELRRQYAAD